MQPFGHNRNGPKIGEGLHPLLGEGDWADAYLRAKYQLHPSSRLAAINMDQKFGGGTLPLFWGGGAGSPSNTVAWAEVYLHTK